MKVNVLGTDYTIIKRKYEVDKNFKEMSCDGYCDSAVKEVVICDMSTYPNNSLSSPERNEIIEKQICKHEIVHAFFKAQKRRTRNTACEFRRKIYPCRYPIPNKMQ